jgi:hypothetical protein
MFFDGPTAVILLRLAQHGRHRRVLDFWAQPRRTIEDTWNPEAKDRLERRMCRAAVLKSI